MPVFANNCTTSSICHGQPNDGLVENLYLGSNVADGENTPDGIASVHMALVGVKALENPSMDLVAPGDPDGSFLWHKIVGDMNSDSTVMNGCLPVANGPMACTDCIPELPCGVPMPLGMAIDMPSACVIKNWIAQGATAD